jgi:ABC-type multidrug transport system fused ATPase/permease subunit
LALLAPYRAQVVGVSLLIALGSAVAQLAPQFARYVLDVAIPAGDLRTFGVLALVLVVYYVLREALEYAGMFVSFAFTQRVVDDVRRSTYAHLLTLPLARFTRERSGSLVSRVVADVNALEAMIQAAASRIVGQLFSIVVVLALMFAMHWPLALVAVLVVVAMSAVTMAFQEPLRRLARAVRAKVGDMTAVATEAIGHIATVKGFTAEAQESERFGGESRAYRRLNLERRRHLGLMQGGIGLAGGLGAGAILVIGGVAVSGAAGDVLAALPGPELSVGVLVAFLLYLGQLMGPVVFVLNFNNQLQAGVAALERLDELITRPSEPSGDQALPDGTELVMQGVRFRYPEAERPALDGFDLTVPAGRTVALVGASGGGKSTVTRLVQRLYDPEAGRIALGGVDLRDLDLRALRRAIAIVPQEPTVFSGSVLENVRYGSPEADEADVLRALALAGAATFVRELPHGSAHRGGRARREALGWAAPAARHRAGAAARRPGAGARRGHVAPRRRGRGGRPGGARRSAGEGSVTMLVIAHRLATVRDADAIAVVEGGRVVERGDHATLIARGGRYARLHTLQHRGLSRGPTRATRGRTTPERRADRGRVRAASGRRHAGSGGSARASGTGGGSKAPSPSTSSITSST